MTQESNQALSPNKQALLKIRELRQQLADAQQSSGEPIAIVATACRFPRRSHTPEQFWQSLIDQTDEVSEIPANRWDLEAFYNEDADVPGKMYARRGVFLDDLDLMDPEFFGISPREATWVDPQQRLLMEASWEAMERAGWTPGRIGQRAGVFVGWMHNDYQNESSDSFLNLNPYIATGAAGSFLPGRLAYYLGLQGPSIAVDAACSSSLVALHLACQSLQRRDCDHALVGGVNAICSPTTNILTCKLKALSPTGQSRAFDAAADGYLRGEGCGVVALRRLSDAVGDRDPVLAVIRGSSVGHNGASSGLTAPNPHAQQQVIRQALERANVRPADIAYLEAHGTGTELGDPIEMRAAAAALGVDRSSDDPLLVGSVKTNIGHLEAAAGMAGLIKVVLALQHDQIPGQLHFENPNPHIPWESMPVRVLTEATDWPRKNRRLAGVSAFGMSGTNAHVVIEAPESNAATTVPSAGLPNSSNSMPQLLVLSAKSSAAISALAEKYAAQISDDPATPLADIAYSAGTRREHFDHRASLVATDREEASEALRVLTRGGNSPALATGDGRRSPKVGWQFTGQGAQYAGMTRGLYDSYPVFRNAIDQCDAGLRALRGESLLDVLFDDEESGDDHRIDHTHWTQPGLFAVQMGLASLLTSWGLRPDVVWGHSVGQYAAACVAGIMTWDDGLRLISERGRLIGSLPAGGKMLAAFTTPDGIEKAIASTPDVSLAAVNGTHVVVSGPAAAIDQVERVLKDQGTRCKPLNTSHAFHSSLMDPALEPFQRVAESVHYEKASVPLICNRTGKVLDADAVLDAAYWARHIREPVRFAESIETAQEIGCDLIAELGPQSVLTRMAAGVWRREPERLFACLQKDEPDDRSLLRAVGQFYVHGATPDFEAIHAGRQRRRVLLPTYPFQRRRFWGPDKPSSLHAEIHTAHPLLGRKVSLAGVQHEVRYESSVEPDSPPWMSDHEVMGRIVVPGAVYIEMALAAAGSRAVENFAFESALQLGERTRLQSAVRADDDGRDVIEIFAAPASRDQWTRHARAAFAEAAANVPKAIDLAGLKEAGSQRVPTDEFYQMMQDVGLNYGGAFQTIEELHVLPGGVLTRLTTRGDIRGFTVPPPLLDGALHSLAVGLLREDDGNLFLPVRVGRVDCFRPVDADCWCYARWRDSEGSTRAADLTLFDDDGRIAIEIEKLEVQPIDRTALRRMSGAGPDRLLHEIDWQEFRLPGPNAAPDNWLLVSNRQAVDCGLTSPVRATPSTDWNGFFNQLSTPDQPYCPAGVAWLLDGDDPSPEASPLAAARTHCEGLLSFIQTLHARGIRDIDCGLLLITTGGVAVDVQSPCSPDQSQFWGLGRVIGGEQPGLRCRLIDLPVDATDADHALVTDILLAETHDSQFAIRNGKLLTPRLKSLGRSPGGAGRLDVRDGRSFLVTGGLGALGRQAARWLADRGAKQIVLTSRRAPDEATRALLDEIEAAGCQIIVHSADVSQREDVRKLFARFGTELLPLAGVVHAAGIVDDALLEEQSWDRFEKVLKPKAAGAALLHEFTVDLPLDFFILYSSASSVLGPPGQANYATANAYLDGLAAQRRAQGLPAISLNWGPWSEGMAGDERIRKRLKLQGITPLASGEAHEAMEYAASAGLVQSTVIDVNWQKMQAGMGGQAPPLLADLAPARQTSQQGDTELVAQLRRLAGGPQRTLLIETLQGIVQGILASADRPDADRPLMEMGLDSLMAVEFGAALHQVLGEQFAVGPTMLFDHPTIDAIATHILELVGSDDGNAPDEQVKHADVVEARPESRAAREDVAIVGMSCRFPGAANVDQFWANLLGRVDSVCEIPGDRWDVDRFYSAEPEPGKMISRQGGFLDGIGDFDAKFFNLSRQEACWIDPQHRLLLENSYLALEHAGISPRPMADSNVGVFMGIMGQDYAFLPRLDDQHIIEAFQGAGLSHSAGVGRISYAFGFEGPCVAVDTASSSSLVALIQAVRSLQDGNCNMALAGGVNAILAPVNSLLMSKAGLLAPDGRCKSFSAHADGFGRGEGCGVVVLKRLSDAQSAGDRIFAVVRGGAVVHNGHSSSITSPSSRSQTRVIRDALKDARLAPSQVQYLEAHGTGTEFGDPLELAAAASAYGEGRQPDKPLLVGSVKANISHLEAAGGISGVIKTALALHHGMLPPQLHFDEPNQHIPWSRMPLSIVAEPTAWPEAEERIAGVTALGLAGTNAHVILSIPAESIAEAHFNAHPAANSSKLPAPDSTRELLVLSARDEAALQQLAHDYEQFFEEHPDANLADVCHTAATGRSHYEHRLAVVATTSQECRLRLRQKNLPTSSEIKAPPKIAWTFTDAQRPSSAAVQRLYHGEPVVRSAIDGILSQIASESLSDAAAELQDFALHVALSALWKSWGVEPDAVLGFGVGQISAACAAGVLSWDNGLTLVVERQRVLAAKASDRAASLDRFEEAADAISYYPPNIPLICSLAGEPVPIHRSLGGSYWRRHCGEPALVRDSLDALLATDCDVFLELSCGAAPPQKMSAEDQHTPPRCIASVPPKGEPLESLLTALGQLYLAGATLDFAAFRASRPGQRISLPGYPFQRQRYWITEVDQYQETESLTVS